MRCGGLFAAGWFLWTMNLLGAEPIRPIPGANPGYVPPSTGELFTKSSEEAQRGRVYVGPFLQQGQSRPTGSASPIPAYAYGLELGYAKPIGTFGETGFASLSLGKGKVGSSSAVFELEFRSFLKLGYGTQINPGFLGAFFIQTGLASAEYSNKLSDGSTNQSLSSAQSFVYGLGYQAYFEAMDRLWVTAGLSWSYYSFYVEGVKNNTTQSVEYPKLSVGLHVWEALVGLFYKV